jgi:hypothetical protein
VYIAIPSRSRGDKIGMMLDRLPPAVYPDVRIFVPVSQQGRYTRNILPKHDGVRLKLLSDDYRMAEVRDHIGRTAIAEGADHFLMIDDDVRFEQRRDATTTRTKTCDLAETQTCLDYLDRYLRDGRWGMVGLPARQFQHAVPTGGPDDIFCECTRNMCVTGWRSEDFRHVDYKRVMVRSDFDATLQLLRNGRKNINLCYWQHSQVNNVAGGCADYRTTEIADAAALRLVELHPGLVTVVRKKYEAQSRREKLNMGERLEVVINWRKAYEEGLRSFREKSLESVS